MDGWLGMVSERNLDDWAYLIHQSTHYYSSLMKESGFVHSAFTFAYESLLGRSNIRNAEKSVPPGALISFLQKGLQYVGIEENLQREATHGKKGQNVEKGTTLNGSMHNFTLLAPKTIRALTRVRPPIQLNVSAAAAAAAVKSRLEAEAKIQADKKTASVISNETSSTAEQNSLLIELPTQQLLLNGQDQSHIPKSDIPKENTESVKRKNPQMGKNVTTGSAAFPAQKRRFSEVKDSDTQKKESLDPVNRLEPPKSLASVTSNSDIQSKKKKGNGTMNFGGQQGPASETTSTVPLHLQQGINRSNVLESSGVEKKKTGSEKLSEPSTTKSMDFETDNSYLNRSQHINGISGNDDLNRNGSTSKKPSEEESIGKEMSVSRVDPRHRDSTTANEKSSSQDAIIDEEDRVTHAAPSEVLELNKHSSEVFMCAWNPVYTDLIATGSGDASARIWQMGGPNAAGGCSSIRELPHGVDSNDRKNKDVTTLEWSSDGKLLATGSYDGVARVWSRTGVLVHTLSRHRGPIFSLKWNRSGNYLLSGSYDQTTIVWDVSGSSGQVVQQFNDHTAPALDVDWKDDTTFASCSTDKTVLICRVGVDHPLRTYSAHLDEVNAVKWDPSGTLLASCSDDYTAKVWNVASDRSDPMYDFKDHKAEIYTLKW
jgi:WD40 repeat protein